MKKKTNDLFVQSVKAVAILIFISGCTKTRQAELPEKDQPNVFAINEFGTPSDNSSYQAVISGFSQTQTDSELRVLDQSNSLKLSSDEVNVPSRIKFMFSNLPLVGKLSESFKITFSVDKDYLTAYKIVNQVNQLSALEKSIAVSVIEVQLISQSQKTKSTQLKSAKVAMNNASEERLNIKLGKKEGSLLVPLFKYKIESYGVLERTKNELKESTSTLELKKTDWMTATHIQITSQPENRLLVGMNADQIKIINQLFNESKLDKQIMTAEDIQNQFKVDLHFLKSDTKLLTELDEKSLHLFKISNRSQLNSIYKNLLKNQPENYFVKSCQSAAYVEILKSTDSNCVLELVADIPVSYKSAQLELIDINGNSSHKIDFVNISKSKSVGLIEVLENSIVKKIGNTEEQNKEFSQIYEESQIDNQLFTAEEFQNKFKIKMKFIDDKTKILTRLDTKVVHIYEVTTLSSLTENQKRLLANKAGNQELIMCSDSTVSNIIQSNDKHCVLVLKADVALAYVKPTNLQTDLNETSAQTVKIEELNRSQSIGLVKIIENSPAKQVDISGVLDPNSSVRISDLKGEFFYRRTFESASNMFLGRTGTSGDMAIIRFELEDNRIVVRNQQSLIKYTGQGPKDREELMSFPVKYIRMKKIATDGSVLAIPESENATKENAEYALIDWTKNTVPDSNSPLAFYAGGDCIMATSSQKVSDTDMRLATDGILNFSISGSYTVKPIQGCFSVKDVNSAYWGGSMQFNYNISERISFMKHKNTNSDIQFSKNISSMAQAAFNFGVFTLADKVKENGTLDNRDGSEKYMPLIHDFRNGRKLKYYIGGLNNSEVTSPERRKLIIEASQQVIEEWNKTLRYAFKGTSLERAGDYLEMVVDEGESTGHLGDLDRNYIWFQELQAENGLLGVAQPAANPRSGTIESANVIVYSGNTYDQTERLLKMTEQARTYEKMIESIKEKALEEARDTKQVVVTSDEIKKTEAEAQVNSGQVDRKKLEQITQKTKRLNNTLLQSIKALQLDNQNIKSLIKNMKMQKSNNARFHQLSKDIFKDQMKGQSVDYPVNENTFLKKLTSLVINKKLNQDPHRMELALNSAFIQYGQLDQSIIEVLKTRSEILAAIVKFNDNTKNRPGCFLYARNDVNDANLTLDPDPKKNFELNFKKNIMSTLSHELGHAFGLLHNFKASVDKANYEFGSEKTGRNYSSIMDYIADVDMTYAGPGPYDAHAIRAAYTGLIELSAGAQADASVTSKLKVLPGGLVSIDDLLKANGIHSLVHFRKDTINKTGLLKYYEQCDDEGVGSSSLCARFDNGGSATEIVQNQIADYTRSYVTRNYVYDKILFGWPQKIQIIQRNIGLFQGIRSYLDEAIMTAVLGTGRTETESQQIMADLTTAAKKGYTFFHELIRMPDAPGVKFNEVNKRFIAIPYEYSVAKTDSNGNELSEEKVKDIKILEARSIYDVNMSRDKMNTVGIGYDKVFAMQFLMQSSAAQLNDDSQVSQISYIDFEQFFMNVKDPSESPTLQTILDILSNNLKSGFFAPSQKVSDRQLIVTDLPVEVNRFLGNQTAVASVIGLEESKWKNFDLFSESFKVGRSSAHTAPQDRFSVAKAGQNRQLSDTRVYFAGQNAVGANSLITNAARNEVFVSNKALFFEMMKNLYESDFAIRKLISAVIAKTCVIDETGKPKDAAACEAAQQKKIEDYIKELPELAPHQEKISENSKKLVFVLRNYNSKELLMPKDLDKADSAMNFERQIEVLRVTLFNQISLVLDVLNTLENTAPENFQATVQVLVQTLSEAKLKNDQLAEIPLFALSQEFIGAATKDLSVKLQGNQGIITGNIITNLLVNKTILQERYDKQLEVIQQLGTFTGLVDPDTVLQ